jgi:arginyl-tRNA synthetase
MNTTLRSITEDIFSAAFTDLEYDTRFAQVVKSNRPDLCQFQCNGALAMAKKLGDNPRNIAQKIVEHLKDRPLFSSLDIAGPGFINITLTDEYIRDVIEQRRGVSGFSFPDQTSQTVVIDFGGPNVAKPMHVGHLRSAIIGDCLQRLFREMNYTVISDNHMGDWGTQMGMLITELKKEAPDLPYFDLDFSGEYPSDPPVTIQQLEEMYPRASAACKEDELRMAEALRATDELQGGHPGYVALWKHFVTLSVHTLKRDFERLGVSFDFWLGESFYMDRMKQVVARLKKEGFAHTSDGALVMDVSRKDDKKEFPPVMLEKSEGGFLYATSDIATIEYRQEAFGPARISYVVDKRQGLHFEQVFRAVQKSRIISEDVVLEHVGFGTVNGPDGKPFKTRSGGVMKLHDLIEKVVAKACDRMDESGIAMDFSADQRGDIADKVGLAALKFADLSNHRLSDYIFDIDKFSRFEGKTGPYILYTAVRIKSILRKVEQAGFSAGKLQPFVHGSERDLLLELAKYSDVLYKTAEDSAPNYLCDYIYDISQVFNRFYRDCHILREENALVRGSWIATAQFTLRTMEHILSVLGIGIPERM